MRFVRRAVPAIGLLLASTCAVLAGCSEWGRSGFEVINRLEVPIDVIYIKGANRIPIVTDLRPGESYEINQFVGGGECVNDTMIAMDQSGSVVETFPGPVCDGLDWIVGPEEPSPSPPGFASTW